MLPYLPLFSLSFIAINGQEYFPGACGDHKIAGVENFNLTKFTGTWYELKRYETFLERDVDCVIQNYDGLFDTAIVLIHVSMYNLKDHKNRNITAVAEEKRGNEGALTVKIPFIDTIFIYWIVATDYQNYAIVWTCSPYNTTTNSQGLWILGRNSALDKGHLAEISKKLEANHFDQSRLRTTQNGDKCRSSAVITTINVLSVVFIMFTKFI